MIELNTQHKMIYGFQTQRHQVLILRRICVKLLIFLSFFLSFSFTACYIEQNAHLYGNTAVATRDEKGNE